MHYTLRINYQTCSMCSESRLERARLQRVLNYNGQISYHLNNVLKNRLQRAFPLHLLNGTQCKYMDNDRSYKCILNMNWQA